MSVQARVFSRRKLLVGVGAALFGVAAAPLSAATAIPAPDRPSSRLDLLVNAIPPVLDLKNAHTGEHLQAPFFLGTGYARQTLGKANWLMRDWREKEEREMDIRLFWALAALRQAVIEDGHSGQIIFLSGFRTKRTNDLLRSRGRGAARNSFHLSARAVDFVIPGVSVAHVARYAKWLQVGGVGHYPSNFIHIDTGRERTWTG